MTDVTRRDVTYKLINRHVAAHNKYQLFYVTKVLISTDIFLSNRETKGEKVDRQKRRRRRES